MAQTHFRLQIGQAIGSSFSIYVRNFVPFTFLCVLVLAPWIALRLLVPFDPDAPLLQAGALVLASLLGYLLTGALTFGVVQQLRGKHAGIGDAIARGLESFVRILGTGILVGLRILLFLVLFLLPGIVFSPLMILAGPAAAVAAIVEWVRLFVAIPAAVMEGKGGWGAVERSLKLTKGSRWRVFAAWFVVTVVFGFGLAFVVGFLIAASGDVDVDVDSPWIDIVTTLLTAPLQAIVASVIYFQLRKGTENVDVEELAAVFD